MTGETLHVLLPLAVVWGAAVILPGPNFLVVVWTAAARGRRDAVLAALGVLTGALFWISAGLFGLKALFVATAASSYRAGLATNLSNPKSAAVAASLLAVALPQGAPALLGVEAFLLLIAISSSWYLSVAVVGSMPAVVHAFVAARRRITQGAGALFVLFGLRLALER
jgi:threonine/homoserine/homoserine lactone efflux protein